MSLNVTITGAQIKTLSRFFTDVQLAELFGITDEQIQQAFPPRTRVVPNIKALPVLLEAVLRVSGEMEMITDGLQTESFKVNGEMRGYKELVKQLSKRVDEIGASANLLVILQDDGIERVWQICEENSHFTYNRLFHYFFNRSEKNAHPLAGELRGEAGKLWQELLEIIDRLGLEPAMFMHPATTEAKRRHPVASKIRTQDQL